MKTAWTGVSLATAILLTGCSNTSRPPERTTSPSTAAVNLGWEALLQNQPEPLGYGLYSYVLMTDEVKSDLGTAVLAAVVGRLHTAESYRNEGISTDRINLLLLPLRSPAIDNPTGKDLFQLFDFVRADNLMRLAHLKGAGPYLITVTNPIPTNGPMPGIYLSLNLSRTNPNMAESTVVSFRDLDLGKAQGDNTRLNEFASNFRLWLGRNDTQPVSTRPVLALFQLGGSTILHK